MANKPEFCSFCGREWRPHCPDCGSQRCYALVSKQDKRTNRDGTETLMKVYRCTRCGARFNDDDWQNHCAAKPYRAGRPPNSAYKYHQTLNPGGAVGAESVPGLLERPDVQEVLAQFYAERAAKQAAQAHTAQSAQDARRSLFEATAQSAGAPQAPPRSAPEGADDLLADDEEI